ncbi:glucosyltransferase [Orbilia oligospora]|uniref:Dol-P-Glc:Glc(2)Man(9)GlcNAc(2)-PP-Dol alpha-1,2-glucosyltransferase n=1 Tax=Orbilia oligospora TaxID=2813651 RepID=A0A8H8VEM7_ORBOL|nr:glucosyltransferase [Orbilia oligospora]
MTTMPQSSSSSSSSPTDRKGNKQEDRPIVKMDPLLRDDFQLYLRVALLLSISVYTAIKVNSVVVDPYLDEVFHIPQAQRYCLMHFKDWDDKITTPPGLYLLSYVYVGFVQTILPIYRFVLQNIPTFSTTPTGWETKPGATSSFTHASLEHCSTVSLRFLNVIGGSIFVPWLVYEIYLYVQSPYHQVIPPPIPVVVVAGPGPGGSLADPKEVEKAKRKTELPPGVGPKEPVPKVDVIEERLNYEASAAQTAMNVALFPLLYFFNSLFYTDIWSTVFVLLAYRSYLLYSPWTSAGWSLVSLFFRQTNILWTIFLVLLSAIRILKRLHPPAPSSLLNHHPLTLSAILGRAGYGGMYDPSIIHSDVSDYFKSLLSIAISGYSNLSPVLIAIEPYIYVVSLFGFFVYWNGSIALGDKTNHVSTFHPVQLFYFSLFTLLSTPFVFLTNPINIVVTTVKSLLGSPLKAISTITAGLLIAGAVHQFTYTHPFMLADNRHYVFYIWRRTILSHRNAKYLGIPLYLFSSFFVYRQIGVKPPALPPSIKSINPQSSAVVYTTHTITFLLAFLAATAGTLVFAPLVEFRYFVVPWVMWRVHIGVGGGKEEEGGWWRRNRIGGVDLRVWMETVAFLGVHAVTTKIFLEREFRWAGTPGVQRFMW